jgi:hypothetical protein
MGRVFGLFLFCGIFRGLAFRWNIRHIPSGFPDFASSVFDSVLSVNCASLRSRGKSIPFVHDQMFLGSATLADTVPTDERKPLDLPTTDFTAYFAR